MEFGHKDPHSVPDTVGGLLDAAAQRYGQRDAVTCDGDRITFNALAEAAVPGARGLIAAGLKPGDRVALLAPNSTRWIVAALAVVRSGGILVPLNTGYGTEELADILRRSRASMLITAERFFFADYGAMLMEIMPDLQDSDPDALTNPGFPDLRRIIVLDEASLPGSRTWSAILAGGGAVGVDELELTVAAVQMDDPHLIAYTSGTSALPKGVVHSHSCLRNVTHRAARLGVTNDDVILVSLPFFHLLPYSDGLLMSLLTGARLVVTDRFEAALCLDLIASERVTFLFGYERHYRALIAEQGRTARDLSSLRLGILPSGLETTSAIARTANEVLCPTVSGYGMTETWALITVSAPTDTLEQRCAASGWPLEGIELRIVDPERSDTAPGEQVGELCVRGESLMEGFDHDPEATARAFDDDGWFHTGDLCVIRDDGHLQFRGRLRDILKVGWENVSPAEIEAFLMRRADVAEAAVVGVPDPELDEVPVAVVVSTPGAAPSEQEIRRSCRGRIAAAKIPRRVFFADSLPLTESGKVRRAAVRDLAMKWLGDERKETESDDAAIAKR